MSWYKPADAGFAVRRKLADLGLAARLFVRLVTLAGATLRRFGLTELRPGQVVLVRFGDGDKGLMAAEIHPDNPAPGNRAH